MCHTTLIQSSEISPATGPWFGGTEITVKGQYFASGRDIGDGIAEKPVVTVGGR